MKNNIFVYSGTIISRSNELSSDVSYNCFFNNEVNFIGYPGTYGSLVMNNSNDTPCDIAFNIFIDPLISDSITYKLLESSPCLDAADPNSEKDSDNTVADMGAYGSSGAKGWITTNITAVPTVLMNKFSLNQNYPNPFNVSTTINYNLQDQGEVKITIYDLYGKQICTLLNELVPKGNHNIKWNGKDNFNNSVKNGTYFCELRFGNRTEIKKMVFMK